MWSVAAGASRTSRVARPARRVEALREQDGEVRLDQLGQLLGRRERRVRRGVVVADPPEELGEARFALGRLLQVDELRHLGGREPVLVLEAGDLLVGRDPAVVLPVDPHEDVALVEVGAVQLLRRMRPGTELEHDRCEAQPFDRGACGTALGLELLQGRAHEDAQPLVGRADARAGAL